MPYYTTVLAGAGFKITELQELVKRNKMCCDDCSVEQVSNYCSECGGKVSMHQKMAQKSVWISDIIGSENLESVVGNGKETIFSQSKACPIEVSQNNSVRITNEIIEKSILEFKKVHKKDIEKIEEFISEKVIVEFFVIHDRS